MKTFLQYIFLLVFFLTLAEKESRVYGQPASAPDSTILYLYSLVKNDSTPMERYVYKYNAAGKVIESVQSDWQKQERRWKLNEKKEFEYDNAGRPTGAVKYYRDDSLNAWIPNGERQKITYNKEGKEIVRESQTFFPDKKAWINSTRKETTYDAKGNVVLEMYYLWNPANKKWENNAKKEIQYTASGQRELVRNYSWSQGQWILTAQNGIRYDNQGRKKKMTDIFWDSKNGCWKYYQDSATAWDSKGNIIESINAEYNEKTNRWEPRQKNIFQYDDKGNIVMHVIAVLDSASGKWIEGRKTEYAYDDKSRVISHAVYQKTYTSNEWIPSTKEEYSYLNDSKRQIALYEKHPAENRFMKKTYSEITTDTQGRVILIKTYSDFKPSANQYALLSEEKTVYDQKGRIWRITYIERDNLSPDKKILDVKRLYYYYAQ